jgi:hypothetical protein
MDQTLFSKFSTIIRNLPDAAFQGNANLDESLLIERDGDLAIYYAPFDHVNPNARIVIVGITPGQTQALNALKEARRQLRLGADLLTALVAAKGTGAFSGAMRPNLIGLLNHIGVQQWLGIPTAEHLFTSASHLLQTSSVLVYPVLIKDANYNGTPSMIRHPVLNSHLIEHFGRQTRLLSDALFVPLGDRVAETLDYLAQEGIIKAAQILRGLPHPSGANAERIAYFLGNKPKSALSGKTDPVKIDIAKLNLLKQMNALRKAA